MALRLGDFHPFNLQSERLIYESHNLKLGVSDDGWQILTLTEDPQIIFDPGICALFKANSLIILKLRSDTTGMVQLFWDDGNNFVAREGVFSTTARIQPGENTLALAVGSDNCKRIRLDPTNEADRQMLIRSISVAPLSISHRPFRVE
jgi:hypothetical protein